MTDPTGVLQALRAATAELVREVGTTSDADLAAASRCAGWSRGHVLTHLARNADGIAAALAGMLRGEVVARYPGGDAQRDADIEAGAGRPATIVLADVRDCTEKLDRVLAAVHEAGRWDEVAVEDRTAAQWVWRRLREVEIHHVDLALGYEPPQWAPLFVRCELETGVDGLGARLTGAVRITVTDGSTVPELTGSSWTVGSGEPVEVSGPDWALAAWLAGRPGTVTGHLSSAPALTD